MGAKWVQCQMHCGPTWLTCLLPDGSVKVGDRVTLKDDEYGDARWWDIVKVGQPIGGEHVHRTWKNNI